MFANAKIGRSLEIGHDSDTLGQLVPLPGNHRQRVHVEVVTLIHDLRVAGHLAFDVLVQVVE
jgi:hypothetical protein